jgi:hypothetical protein
MEIDGINRVGVFIACDIPSIRGLSSLLGKLVQIRAAKEAANA